MGLENYSIDQVQGVWDESGRFIGVLGVGPYSGQIMPIAAAAQAALFNDKEGPGMCVYASGGDDTAAINAAINAVYAAPTANGGTVYYPDKLYRVSGIVNKPGVSHAGIGATLSEYFSGQAETGRGESTALKGTVWLNLDNATQPMFRNDTEVGTWRQDSNVLNEVDNTKKKQRYGSFEIRDISLSGNANNQTEAWPLIALERVWSVRLFKCNILHSRGYGLSAIDCNTLTVVDTYSHYAPWFIFDTADSQITGCSVSGSKYYAAAVWMHGQGTANNLLTNNLFYNSSQNDAAAWTNPNDTVSHRIRRRLESATSGAGAPAAGNDTLFNVTSHKWYDGECVVFDNSAGGTLPAGALLGKVYWVKRVNGNTIKLAENLNRMRLGVFLQCTDAGAGTVYLDKGYKANWLLTGGAQRNQGKAMRLDQSYGHGFMCVGAPLNEVNATVNQAGLGNAEGCSAALLRKGYVEVQPNANTLVGSYGCTLAINADGTLITYGGMNSNQAYGINVEDAESEALINTVGSTCVNHATADYLPRGIGSRSVQVEQSGQQYKRSFVGDATDLVEQVLYTRRMGMNLGRNGRLKISLVMAANNAIAKGFRVTLTTEGGFEFAIKSEVAMANKYYPLRDHRVRANNATSSLKYFDSVAINSASSVDATVVNVSHVGVMTLKVYGRATAQPAANDWMALEDIEIEQMFA